MEAGKKPASTFRLSWRAFAALWIKRFGGFVGQQGIEDKREKFSGTRPPLKGPLRRRFKQRPAAFPGNRRYDSDIPFNGFPVGVVFLGYIRIKPFCHQQKPVLLLHAQRHRVSSLEKTFMIWQYSELVEQVIGRLVSGIHQEIQGLLYT